jgi:hypothetical protein
MPAAEVMSCSGQTYNATLPRPLLLLLPLLCTLLHASPSPTLVEPLLPTAHAQQVPKPMQTKATRLQARVVVHVMLLHPVDVVSAPHALLAPLLPRGNTWAC